MKLNCAAIPTGLLESELFGHERGAFTGAIATKIGRFETADRGTLFLDEVGEIPLELQVKLLRVLQEQEFERLGSTRTMRVNVRVVAATNRDLEHMVEEQRFRSDLYYRLKVFPIMLPPLRERAEDISRSGAALRSEICAADEKTHRDDPAEAMKALQAYPWPGNVRELENFIERAVILTSGSDLRARAVRAQSAVSALERIIEDTRRCGARAHPQSAARSEVDDRRLCWRGSQTGHEAHDASVQDAEARHHTPTVTPRFRQRAEISAPKALPLRLVSYAQ